MARAREVRRANAAAERVSKLFGALTRRAGHAHARRALERACGTDQPSKLPVAKWQRAALALRIELQAVTVADRALAIVRSRLVDDADDAVTAKARRVVGVHLAEYADAAITSAIERHDRAAQALEANRREDEEAASREAANNFRANSEGLSIVDEGVTLPWLVVWRARSLFDEAHEPANHIKVDDPAPDARIAFDIGNEIGTARVEGDSVRFVFSDGPEFTVPRDTLGAGFEIAAARQWFDYGWRDDPVDAHRYGDGAGCFVTR